MLDNLDLNTDLSETFDEMEKYDLAGRYYHMSEIDSICPVGWRIPNVEDWISYFKFLAVEQTPGVELEITSIDDPVHYTISNYSDKIDLFADGNLLELKPTGRVEGEVFNLPDNYADYWTFDANEEVEGRSHIHIMNPWTTIHSHKHHLKLNQKNKLRKFMIRCVINENPNISK